MENKEYLTNNGLFSNEILTQSLPESFETIFSLFKTIKEYRDYAKSDSPLWDEYIYEFFHVLGFSTEEINPRLIRLNVMGSDHSPKAIMGLIHPGDDFEDIISGMPWISCLFYAAKYYQVEWGILMNGLSMKIYNFGRTDYLSAYYLADLEGIIKNERLDSFFTLYKVLSSIKGKKEKVGSIKPREVKRSYTKSARRSAAGLPPGLANILDVCIEVFDGGYDYSKAVVIVAERNHLKSIHTVADSCTRRIGLNTKGFRKLLANKSEMIEYLSAVFPAYAEEIKKTIENTI